MLPENSAALAVPTNIPVPIIDVMEIAIMVP